MRRAAATLTAIGLLAGTAIAYALTRAPASSPASGATDTAAPTPGGEPRTAAGPHLKFLAAGGGSVPELNQVSIEQDLGLAREVLPGPGRVLFAAGASAPVVQVLDGELDADRTLVALGDLFSPRGGRDATYRAPRIEVDGPATASRLVADLRASLADGEHPLLVVVAGHGLAGEVAAHNTVELWGHSAVSVADLAAVAADARRPMQLIATTCFSGGFADIVFQRADPTAGPSTLPHCGLFATTWDLEASGCDPNPERSQQQGYALHFFHALMGQDRDGVSLPLPDLDLDRDGRVSLLEAHTRVRIASSAPDVPTTTSERWLRAVAPELGEADATIELPEERAVIEALGRRLGLAAEPDAAASKLAVLDNEIRGLEHRLQGLQQAEDETYRAAAAELLARWPVLDDPWHPQFGESYAVARDEIAQWLHDSSTWAAYVQARDNVGELVDEIGDKRAQAAPFERLARAVETVALAQRLAGAGGAPWARYQALLACERAAPVRVKSP